MITIDEENNSITLMRDGQPVTHSLASPQGFEALSQIWLRSSWDTRHMYSFTWLGTPIIQLPEDILRLQELIFQIKPDLLIETGVNYGGSLLLYASLFELLGRGRTIGIDVTIRPELHELITTHRFKDRMDVIQGSSIDETIVQHIAQQITPGQIVMVTLDSLHTKEHVLRELELYAPLVSVGSYIVVMDGIMGHLKHAQRKRAKWEKSNPEAAARAFATSRDDFEIASPPFLFNDGKVEHAITNFPSGFLKRVA